ncbi:MAG: FAD-dependent monooxygenase [Anaerolineae bacterium]|nr:FAD-dependent monooxygenase [Anaerolineae bacterium]
MTHVTIVGAGLVGCLLSIYLAQAGHKVTIFDQMPDPRQVAPKSNRSISITIAVRGFRALDKVGIGDAVRQISIPIYGRMIHASSGQQTFQPYSPKNEANYAMRRQDLHLILLNFAQQHSNIHLAFNNKCVGLDLATATAKFEDRQTDQIREVQSEVLFGADGAFSSVRLTMQKEKRFNYSQHFIDIAYREIVLPKPIMADLELDPNAFHIWPRENMMMYGFGDYHGDFTLSLVLPYEGANSHETINTFEALHRLLETHFTDIFTSTKPHLGNYFAKPVEPMVTIRCYPWVSGERIALIGDACHAVLPFYGQGANAGFEDCYLLGQCLEQFAGEWSTALQTFQAARKPDTDALADLCHEHAMVLMKSVDDPQFQLRKKIEQALQMLYPERTYLYHNVSFTCLPYTEAVQREESHRRLINRILQIENIESHLDTPEFQRIVNPFLATS